MHGLKLLVAEDNEVNQLMAAEPIALRPVGPPTHYPRKAFFMPALHFHHMRHRVDGPRHIGWLGGYLRKLKQ